MAPRTVAHVGDGGVGVTSMKMVTEAVGGVRAWRA